MKKLFFLLILIVGYCNSQVLKCETVTKQNIYYVSFEIKSKKSYPIKMTGIFETYKEKKFNRKNVTLFIKSFYKRGVYTPYIMKGYSKMLYECADSLNVNSFLNKNKVFVSEISKKIEGDYPSSKIVLDSGEKVSLKVFNISGNFIKVDKNNQGIFTNSMEWDIKDIKEIKQVYVPFDNLQIN